MVDDNDGIPANVLGILKTASEEILKKQDGYCFTVDNGPEGNVDEMFSYNEADVAEFINFDMIGEEDDNLESFSHLITNTNHEDLTGDRKVLKILLNEGKNKFFKKNFY